MTSKDTIASSKVKTQNTLDSHVSLGRQTSIHFKVYLSGLNNTHT